MKKIILAVVALFFPVFAKGVLFGGEGGGLEELFEERIRSVVAVEFFVETEVERQPRSGLGIVADGEGLIVLQDHAVPGWVPVEQMRQFKVRLLRGRKEFEAEYLGQERVNGWHFLRVSDEEFRETVLPVSAYGVAEVRIGERLWGFAAMDEDYDFEPYFLMGNFSLLRALPMPLGFTMTPVTGPGSLVFNEKGELAGWGTISYLLDSFLYVHGERLPVAIQGARESGLFYPAKAFLPYLERVPEDPKGSDIPWAGGIHLQPVEKEVAEFLGIGDQGAVVLSEIIAGSPMAEAGLQSGDVVTAIDGEKIPYYRWRNAVGDHLRREVLEREIGDVMKFSVLRSGEERSFEVTLGKQPPTLREASREYFPKMGITVREFLLFDGVARRTGPETDQGVIVQFVRPNSPAAAAGFQMNDWIKEIDGNAVSEYEAAVGLLREAVDEERSEVVFLISRQNETSVIRMRLR